MNNSKIHSVNLVGHQQDYYDLIFIHFKALTEKFDCIYSTSLSKHDFIAVQPRINIFILSKYDQIVISLRMLRFLIKRIYIFISYI